MGKPWRLMTREERDKHMAYSREYRRKWYAHKKLYDLDYIRNLRRKHNEWETRKKIESPEYKEKCRLKSVLFYARHRKDILAYRRNMRQLSDIKRFITFARPYIFQHI